MKLYSFMVRQAKCQGTTLAKKYFQKNRLTCVFLVSLLLSLHTYKKRRWREEAHHHPLKKMQPAMIFFSKLQFIFKRISKKKSPIRLYCTQLATYYNKFLILGTWINMIYCNDFQNSDTNQVGKQLDLFLIIMNIIWT